MKRLVKGLLLILALVVVLIGCRMAIYDEPSTVYFSAKLMRQNGLEVEKKDREMVLGIKSLPASLGR